MDRVVEVVEVVEVFKGLTVQNEQLYIIFGSDNSEKQMLVKTRKEDIQNIFPKMGVFQGRIYISSDDLSISTEIDPSTELGKFILDEQDLQWLRTLLNKNPLVPDEFKDKYCLLFGGKVLYSADTIEEVKKYENEHRYIAFTTYTPCSHLCKINQLHPLEEEILSFFG